MYTNARQTKLAVLLAGALVLALACSACGGGGGGGETSGPAFEPEMQLASFNTDQMQGSSAAGIDTSSIAEGYVGATAVNDGKLKFQVSCGQTSYNYDLPGDGTPIICPLNMGDGSYTFTVLLNTTGERYVQLYSTSAEVALGDELDPYLHPNVFCSFDADCACTAKAAELTADAANEGDALAAIYNYIVENISYDNQKAVQLSSETGYVPDPNETLESGTGICFDYSALAAAMLRSVGIPCKVVTGYVAPDDIYHAWNMVYIDGTWQTVEISIESNTWSRIDTTFAAGGDSATVGDGSAYTDRYVY